MNTRLPLLLFCIYGGYADIMSEECQPYDTIVVGLGASGTAAATALARAGRRVLALEAMDRVGGRVHTVPVGDGVVEVGAEWIHGTHPSPVYDLAINHNITVIPQDLAFEVFRSDGSAADHDLLNELLNYCLEVVDQSPAEPETVGHYVTRKLKDYLREKHPEVLNNKEFLDDFLSFMNLLINNYEASNDWNDVSAVSKYEDLEGDLHMSWHKYGYKTLFEILLNTHNNGPGLPTLDIKLGTEVTAVRWPRDARYVTVTAGGKDYCADNVIVTVSLGVLKDRHTTLFSPKLPQEKLTAIDNSSMGLIGKIILTFPETWWPRRVAFFAFLWRGAEKQRVGKEDYWTTTIFGASSPMGSGKSLTLWTNGEMAKLVETLPEEVVKRKCTELLQRFMGANLTVPEPTRIIRSKWWSNPYTRGSYTYDNVRTPDQPTVRETLAAPLTDRAGKPIVLFAGEHTNSIHYSTVHGAVETGLREAARLLPSSKI